MEPFRTCIKQIIELRELEKSEDQKYDYMDSDSDTESIVSDSGEITEPDSNTAGPNYNCAPSDAGCRDDKYFDAIYKVIDMSPKGDIYGAFGKYIANQIRNVAKLNVSHANEMMNNLQKEMHRLKRECIHEICFDK